MMQADVEELRTRLEEKNRIIEKKTQAAVQAVQERNRVTNELTELKDHMDIKDRKISVLQRKVCDKNCCDLRVNLYAPQKNCGTRNAASPRFIYFGVYCCFDSGNGFADFFFVKCDEIYIRGR